MTDEANSKTKDILVFVAIFIFGSLSIYNFFSLKQTKDHSVAAAQGSQQTNNITQDGNQIEQPSASASSKRTTYVNDDQNDGNYAQTAESSQDITALEELEASQQVQFQETNAEIRQQRSSIIERISELN